MAKCLVTGSKGYVGRYLIDAMGSKNTVKFDIKQNMMQDVRNFLNLPNDPISHIVHLAALCEDQSSINFPFEYFETNLRGTVNLLEYARCHEVEKFLFASSASATEHATPYGLTKHSGEEWCKLYRDLYGMKICVLRIFNIYGPDNPKGVIRDLMKQRANDTLHIFGDGTQIRDYIHISDVVKSIKELMTNESNGLVEIGTGIKTSVNDLIFLFEWELKRRFHVEHLPKRVGDISCSYAKHPYLTTFIPIPEGLRMMLEQT